MSLVESSLSSYNITFFYCNQFMIYCMFLFKVASGRQGTPAIDWTGRQSIAGPTQRDKQSFSHSLLVRIQSNRLICHACLWIVGGNQSAQREPTQTRGEQSNSAKLKLLNSPTVTFFL